MKNAENQATEILDKLMQGEEVSRWEIFGNRRMLRIIIRTNPQYSSLETKVEDEIISAKESL